MTDLRARAGELRDRIGILAASIGRPVRIMEVCGTHTVALRRHGIHSILPETITLVSGPGCPVCVTPTCYIDNAIRLLDSGEATVVTFGDMLKVPGNDGRNLAGFLGTGSVRIVYSPLALAGISLAERRKVVFLAVGFETTIPTVLASLLEAEKRGDERLLYYTAFKTVPAALLALLADPDHSIDGFLLPGHVSIILGESGYEFLPPHGVPGAITGFEPIEMLEGIASLLESIGERSSRVTNAYPAVVKREGNRRARGLIAQMLQPADARWRGLGTIPGSALELSDEYAAYDAAKEYGLTERDHREPAGCRCGEVITGRCLPTECGSFGSSCTPDTPVGPCMVSSEGTCAAYLKYGSLRV